MRAGGVHGLAHITGGGLTENLPRVLPDGLGAEIDLGAWVLPPVFRWLANEGNVPEAEMLKTFNCGIGMVAVVSPDRAAALEAALTESGETVVRLGEVVIGQGYRVVQKCSPDLPVSPDHIFPFLPGRQPAQKSLILLPGGGKFFHRAL